MNNNSEAYCYKPFIDSVQVTKSGNFYDGFGLGEKYKTILKQVKDSPHPISPNEISCNTGLNDSTVRKYLRDLAKWGCVKRKFHGHYVSVRNSVTLGRRMVSDVASIKVHGLRFRVLNVGVGERRWCRDSGVLKLKFVVHGNGTAEVFVDCGKDVSLDYVSFRLVVDVVCRELECCWEQVRVVSCEFNRDFWGLRLDGVKAVTLRAFDGSFRRIYNHGPFMRDEVKTVGSKKIEDVLALMQGGVSQYNIQQLLYMNFQKLSEYAEASKFQNQLFSEAVSRISRLTDALMRFLE